MRIFEVQLRLAAGGSGVLEIHSELLINADGSTLLGDLNGDLVVDFADFFVFADLFGSTDPSADFDGNGTVGFEDFFTFADQFGKREQAKLIAIADRAFRVAAGGLAAA